MSLFKQLQMSIALGPTVVTVAFVVLFIATLVWIYRPGSRRYYDHQANLPMNDSAPGAQHATVMEKRNG